MVPDNANLGFEQLRRSLYGIDKEACTDGGIRLCCSYDLRIGQPPIRCVTKTKFKLCCDKKYLQTMRIDFAVFDVVAFLPSHFSTYPPPPTQRTMGPLPLPRLVLAHRRRSLTLTLLIGLVGILRYYFVAGSIPGPAPNTNEGVSQHPPVSIDPDLMDTNCQSLAPGPTSSHPPAPLVSGIHASRLADPPPDQPLPRWPSAAVAPFARINRTVSLFRPCCSSPLMLPQPLPTEEPLSRPSVCWPGLQPPVHSRLFCPIPSCPDHAPLPVGLLSTICVSTLMPTTLASSRVTSPLTGSEPKVAAFARCVDASSACVSTSGALLVSTSLPSHPPVLSLSGRSSPVVKGFGPRSPRVLAMPGRHLRA